MMSSKQGPDVWMLTVTGFRPGSLSTVSSCLLEHAMLWPAASTYMDDMQNPPGLLLFLPAWELLRAAATHHAG